MICGRSEERAEVDHDNERWFHSIQTRKSAGFSVNFVHGSSCHFSGLCFDSFALGLFCKRGEAMHSVFYTEKSLTSFICDALTRLVLRTHYLAERSAKVSLQFPPSWPVITCDINILYSYYHCNKYRTKIRLADMDHQYYGFAAGCDQLKASTYRPFKSPVAYL